MLYRFSCRLQFQNQEVVPVSQRLMSTFFKLSGNHLCTGHHTYSTQIPVLVGWLYVVGPGAESYRHEHSLYTLAPCVHCGSCVRMTTYVFLSALVYQFGIEQSGLWTNMSGDNFYIISGLFKKNQNKKQPFLFVLCEAVKTYSQFS